MAEVFATVRHIWQHIVVNVLLGYLLFMLNHVVYRQLLITIAKNMSLNFTGSKQQKAFLRKLYIAYLIDSERHNLLSLHKLTEMPRRTLQDAIAALADLAIECEFVQDGERNNAGYYRINHWGAIERNWVAANLEQIISELN